MGCVKCTTPCRKSDWLGGDVPVTALTSPESDHIDLRDELPLVKADRA